MVKQPSLLEKILSMARNSRSAALQSLNGKAPQTIGEHLYKIFLYPTYRAKQKWAVEINTLLVELLKDIMQSQKVSKDGTAIKKLWFSAADIMKKIDGKSATALSRAVASMVEGNNTPNLNLLELANKADTLSDLGFTLTQEEIKGGIVLVLSFKNTIILKTPSKV